MIFKDVKKKKVSFTSVPVLAGLLVTVEAAVVAVAAVVFAELVAVAVPVDHQTDEAVYKVKNYC